MSYIRMSDMEILRKVQRILTRHQIVLDQEEYRTYNDLYQLMIRLEKENNAYRDRAKESMRKYRSTPEGKEKSRISSYESLKRYKERKKMFEAIFSEETEEEENGKN